MVAWRRISILKVLADGFYFEASRILRCQFIVQYIELKVSLQQQSASGNMLGFLTRYPWVFLCCLYLSKDVMDFHSQQDQKCSSAWSSKLQSNT